MALVFMDGFDHYTSGSGGVSKAQEAGWIFEQAGAHPVTSSGRFGGGGMRSGGNNAYFGRAFTLADTTIVVQMAVRFQDLGSDDFLELRQNSGTNQGMMLQIRSSGALRLRDNADVLKNTSASGVILENQWHYLEVKVTAIGDNATVTVRVDEVQVLNEINVDVDSNAYATFDQIRIHAPVFSTVFTDDIVILDGTTPGLSDFLGDVRISTILPDGDSTPTDWTATGSPKHDEVDDPLLLNSDGDTTNIEHDVVGERQLLTMADSPANTQTVHAIGIVNEMSKDDAGGRTALAYVDSGGTVADGDEQSPSTDYTAFRDYYEENPDTLSAWTKTTVDAVKVGVKVES